MRIAVLYEHAEWFTPLFAVLDRRGIDHVRLDAARLSWNPEEPPAFSLLVNRTSPSAFLRGHAHAIHATSALLHYVESWGVAVVNGLVPYGLETSKAAQIDLLRRLGLRHPRTRVINDAAAAVQAAAELRFPILVKPNVGGSGGGIRAFESPAELRAAAASGEIDLGVDDTALVQELLPARGGSITRVEMLDDEVLYAIRITPPRGLGFNLCPADICRDENHDRETDHEPGEVADDPGARPSRPSMRIDATDVTAGVREAVTSIARGGRFDVCGVEYLIDDRDGQPVYYDINALSNFVTDAPAIVGFDPFERFADYLVSRLAEWPEVPRLGSPEALYVPEVTRWQW